MYNKVILMGRIVNDLELKTTPTGVSVLSFRIAVDRRFQTKGEERKSDFFNVVAWRSSAEFISRYFAKGRMIFIDGELQTRSYQDKNGNTAYITEVLVEQATFTGEAKKSDNPPLTTGQIPQALSDDSSADVVASVGDDYPF